MSKKSLLAALASIAALSVAACGGPAAAPAASGSPATTAPAADDHGDHEGHDHDDADEEGLREETPDQSPRIAVGTDAGITILDAALQQVGTFATTARPTLTTAHDDRHVVAVQGEAGVVNILDAGSWTSPHGQHYHYFVADPALLDEALEGGKPVHVVPNAAANSTAVYFDDEARAHSLTTEAMLEKELHGLRTVDAKAPHHGVVVPLADGTWLVTQQGDDALPDTIDWVDDEGTVKATVVEVGAEYSNLVAIPDGTFAVLGTDGTVRIYDAHGHETATFEVTAPWTKGKGHGALAPSLAAGQNAGANTVWVSEPAASKVHAVDLFAKEVTSADVEGNPGSIAVTNAR